MGKYSPYAVAESEPPKWETGENYAAAAFIGAAIFLVLDINLGIWRSFKRRTGTYYWALKLGSLGCLVDAIGVILKFTTPGSTRYWQAYTIILLCGWTTYSTCQLFVLYSRLHLVNDSRKLQRMVLIMIVSTYVLLILPTWIVVWPAWDPNPKVSSLWSPRDAIVERYNQIGFTIVECTLSGVYIWSLLGLLNLKSSIRQRRVMCDLIYVNLVIISLDIVTVILVYLNFTAISHPIQTFNYTLKLKLEFLVLNQLMAVAVRGSRRPRFEELRYHHASARDEFSAECHEWDAKQETRKHQASRQNALEKDSPVPSVQLTLPSPVLSRRHQSSSRSAKDSFDESRSQRQDALSFPSDDKLHDVSKTDRTGSVPEQKPPLDDHQEDAGIDSDDDQIRAVHGQPSGALSGESLRPLQSTLGGAKPDHYHSRFRDAKDRALQSIGHSAREKVHGQDHAQMNTNQKSKSPMMGRLIKRVPKNGRDLDEGCEEEEVDVNMWENRKGSLVMEVPWFKSKIDA